MSFTNNQGLMEMLTAFAIGYLPGAIMGLVLWFWGRRSKAMPLFPADLVSFAMPVFVWLVMHKYHWTLNHHAHRQACELAVLGWIWSFCVILRLLIPCYTHKLRFRMAAIHVGSICTLVAVLLALFYPFK